MGTQYHKPFRKRKPYKRKIGSGNYRHWQTGRKHNAPAALSDMPMMPERTERSLLTAILTKMGFHVKH